MKTLAVALVALLLPAQEKTPQPLALGSPAPEFDVPGVDGKRYTLKDFAQKKLLLVLFDTVHCPTSQAYEERIKRIAEDYKEKGVGILSISPNDPKSVRLDELGYTDLDDSFESMKIRARDHQFNFPFCFDGEPNTVSQAYGPKATPHAFLFDAERKLRYQGGVDDSEFPSKVKVHHLRNALDALLEGKEPPVPTSKVFGCSTKWPNKQKSVVEYNERIAKSPVEIAGVDPAGIQELLKNESGKVRLIHFWSVEKASELAALTPTHFMYGRRNFTLTTVAVHAAGDKHDLLTPLRKPFPPAANKNLAYAGAPLGGSIDPGWNGDLPYTIVVSASNEILFRKQGALDDGLALRRAIVRNLKEDRMR